MQSTDPNAVALATEIYDRAAAIAGLPSSTATPDGNGSPDNNPNNDGPSPQQILDTIFGGGPQLPLTIEGQATTYELREVIDSDVGRIAIVAAS